MADITGEGAPFDTLAATPKYGENPWQGNAGLWVDEEDGDPLSLSRFELVQGSPPSYNNYRDLDRLLQTATHIAAVFSRNHGAVPYIALGAKHGNVCGAAVDIYSDHDAIRKMLDGDPRAIFGGAVMLDTDLTLGGAKELMHYGQEGSGKRLLDTVVVADIADKRVLGALERKGGKLRILTNPALEGLEVDSLDDVQRFTYVRGGLLVQDNYTFVLDHSADYVEKPGLEPTKEQERDLSLAWAIGSTSNSNTITLVRDQMLIGNGVGQQDRVGAAELAIKRAQDAGHSIEGAVAYSDSFFPFPDGVEVLAQAGVKAILTSRGSVQDDAVFGAAEKAGVAVETIPDAVGRGFYAH